MMIHIYTFQALPGSHHEDVIGMIGGSAMTLKKKLSLGLGFLFAIIFTMAIFCSYYIQKLSRESENILKDNYNSIVYSKNMIFSLDDMAMSVNFKLFNYGKGNKETGYYSHLYDNGKIEFEKNLKAENKNITELQEKEYAELLNRDYAIFTRLSRNILGGGGSAAVYFSEFLPVYEKLKQSINSINDVNTQAVVRKNKITVRDSSAISISMAIIGAICLILAVGYIWYFPFYVSNSLSYLSAKMKDLLLTIGIPQKIETDDELNVILQSVSLIEAKYAVRENVTEMAKTAGKKGRRKA
jgi:hypothetical protein